LWIPHHGILLRREFLLRARRKQSQELFAEALPAAEEALKMHLDDGIGMFLLTINNQLKKLEKV
jgi:hypothetical protein